MKMKISLMFLLILIILLGFAPASVAMPPGITVTLNGVELMFDVTPRLIDGRTMVPMRAIFESLGAEVHWDSDSGTITATTGERVVIMQVGNTAMTAGGDRVELDVPPLIINDRTLVPIRAVAEGLLADVNWIGETNSVEILSGDIPETAVPPGNPSVATPPSINLFRHPVTVVRNENYSPSRIPNTRIWGWEESGSIAFSVEYYVDGRGGWVVRFFILNTATDEVVFHRGIDSFVLGLEEPAFHENPEISRSRADAFIGGLYEIMMDSILEAMGDFGIVGEYGEFLPFPTRRSLILYDCLIEDIVEIYDEDYLSVPTISSYNIAITAGVRRISVTEFEAGLLTLGLHVCGFIVSPFGNMAVAVIAEERFTFEGTEIFFVFSGFELA